MKVAVEGCAHGELETIYECIEFLQEKENVKVDLLICCGDFQSVRNNDDLRGMAVPEKYLNICTFHKYYSGEKVAPILTIFIGGNHEASNYLQELPYGGWVAPNIYYLGRAGVVKFGNLRIGGLSGIFNGHNYLQGLWECPPYTPSSLRSVYHVRALDVYRLSQIKKKIDIMLSHDWPQGITEYGDKNELLRRKPFFRDDIESNKLGSSPAGKLLHELKPKHWFAAHLHCQFVGVVEHENKEETRFLALDKCLPKRRHLQILDLTSDYDGDMLLKYDTEWLAVLKNTNHLLSVKNINCYLPGPGSNERYDFTPTPDEIEAVEKSFDSLFISNNSFVKTAEDYNPDKPKRTPTEPVLNPQTVFLCEKLGIDDPVQVVMARAGRTMKTFSPDCSLLSNDTQTENTPIKCGKISLPAPITPIENENEISKISLENSNISFDSSYSPESGNYSLNSDESLSGMTSPSSKRVFKRRNLALYTSEECDEDSEHSSSAYSDSTRPSKLLRTSNEYFSN